MNESKLRTSVERFKFSLQDLMNSNSKHREKIIDVLSDLSDKIVHISLSVKQIESRMLENEKLNLETSRKIDDIESMFNEFKAVQENNFSLFKIDNEEFKKIKLPETTREIIKNELSPISKEISTSIMEKTNSLLDKTMQMAHNQLIREVSNEIFEKISQYLKLEVEKIVKSQMYDEYYSSKISNKPESQTSQSPAQNLKQIEQELREAIKQDEYRAMEENYKNAPEIKKIDVNKIKQKIQEAINIKNDKIENHNTKQEVNEMSEVNHNEEFKISPEMIVYQAKLGIYKLPCFFDGEKIFGVYNPDHNLNMLSSGMNEDIMISSKENMQNIHICPSCEHIKSTKNLNIADSDECIIHYMKDGINNAKKTKLKICPSCLKKIYGENFNEERKFDEFVNDFINGENI